MTSSNYFFTPVGVWLALAVPSVPAYASARVVTVTPGNFSDIDLSRVYARNSPQYQHFYQCKDSLTPATDCNATGPARLYDLATDTDLGNSFNLVNRCIGVRESGLYVKGPIFMDDANSTVSCLPGRTETQVAFVLACVERIDGVECHLSSFCFEGVDARGSCPGKDTQEIVRILARNIAGTGTGTGAGTGAGTSAGSSSGTSSGSSSGSSAGTATGSSTGTSSGSSSGSSAGTATGSSTGSSSGTSAGSSSGTATGTGTGAPVSTGIPYILANDLSRDLVLTSERTVPGTVYYAVYDSDPGVLTAAAVKTAASASPSGSFVRGGSVNVSSASVPVEEAISALPEKAIYYVFAVGESSGVLDASVKKFSGVLPKKISLETYNTAIAGKSGITMRYGIAVPKGYYDDESRQWPLLVTFTGSGETFTDAANAESNYYTGFAAIPMKTHFFSRIQSGVDDIPMIQVTMGCNRAYFTCVSMSDSNMWNELIQQVSATYRVNPKKLYAVGISWGGTGVFHYAKAYPGHLTAAVALMGDSQTPSADLCAGFAASGQHHTSIWALANANDGWSDDANITSAVTTIRSCAGYSGDARVTIFDGAQFPGQVGVGHAAADYTLNTPFWNHSMNRFRWWDGSTEWSDTVPPTRRTPLEPKIINDLNAAGTSLGGSFPYIWDWLNHFTKP